MAQGINHKPWEFYQFQYRDGECVVVVDSFGGLTAFYVRGQTLLRTSHIKTVRPGPKDYKGEFQLTINRSTMVAMQLCADGISRGAKTHWGGEWTRFSQLDFTLAHNRAKDAEQNVPTAPLGAAPPYQHPSGLPECDLEECKACASSYGACVECYNTGMVPKTQQSKRSNNMQDMITVIQLKHGAKIVSAKYAEPNSGPAREYHFKNVVGLTLAAGDRVVVQTKGDYAMVTVVDPDVRANLVNVPLGELKHVVSKVDTAALGRVLEAENNAMHALALSEVTERLSKFKEQIGENAFNTMQGLLAAPAAETKE